LRQGRRAAEHRHHPRRHGEAAQGAARDGAGAHEAGASAHCNADRCTSDRDAVDVRTVLVRVDCPGSHGEPPHPLVPAWPPRPSRRQRQIRPRRSTTRLEQPTTLPRTGGRYSRWSGGFFPPRCTNTTCRMPAYERASQQRRSEPTCRTAAPSR